VKELLSTAMHRLAQWAMWSVHTGVLERTAGLIERLALGPCAVADGLGFRAYAASDRGEAMAAVALAQRLLVEARQAIPTFCPWAVVCTAADIFVNAGRYRLALQAHEVWPLDAIERGREADREGWATTLMNQAEAQLCLGLDQAAAELLESARPHCQPGSLADHGRRLMQAWLLVHQGQPLAARQEAAAVDPQVMTARYRSEYHYTQSLIARALGETETAIAQAREGLRHARRASSRRNGGLALGAAMLAAGDLEPAIHALEAFAAHPYQAQSGPGLLLLASAYRRAGRAAAAAQAQQWARERDPECAAVIALV
jgi:tetratricopeptide (TPR) repeat protein